MPAVTTTTAPTPPAQQDANSLPALKNITAFFHRQEDKISSALVESGLSPDRFINSMMQEINGSEDLQQCTPQSIYEATMEALYLGVIPGKINGGMAHLVKFNNKGTPEAQLIIDYKGFLALAREDGYTITPVKVHEGDSYSYDYSNQRAQHTCSSLIDRGQVIAWYCHIQNEDGREWDTDPMTLDEAEKKQVEELGKIKNESYRKNAPWEKYFLEMWRKTAIRRLYSTLPRKTERMKKAGKALERGFDSGIVDDDAINVDPQTGEII